MSTDFPNSEKINEMAQGALQFTSSIIDKHGPRISGSQSCLDSAETIKEIFSKSCDTVNTDEYRLKPKAFMGFIRVIFLSYILQIIFVLLRIPIISGFFGFYVILVILFEYIFYYQFTDILPIWSIKDGKNVWGVVEPLDTVNNVVVLSGHHDSTPIFNFYEQEDNVYFLRETIAFVTSILYSVWNIILPFTNIGSPKVYLITAIIGIIGVRFLYPLWFFLNEKGTPGAGDNLISVAVSHEVAKYFHNNKLKNTRVIVASFDSEESGLRGSRVFWEKHARELNQYNCYNINGDCIYYHDELRIVTRDINLTTKMDENLVNKCGQIASELGFKRIIEPIPLMAGGCDSGEAARHGIKATTILSIPFTNKFRRTVYHTREDVVSEIEPKAVEQVIAIMTKFCQDLDSGKFK